MTRKEERVRNELLLKYLKTHSVEEAREDFFTQNGYQRISANHIYVIKRKYKAKQAQTPSPITPADLTKVL